MEGHCSTDQSPQWAVVQMELYIYIHYWSLSCLSLPQKNEYLVSLILAVCCHLAVAQLFETLSYKSEGRGFDSSATAQADSS